MIDKFRRAENELLVTTYDNHGLVVRVSPQKLRECFGDPAPGDGFNVSGEYNFFSVKTLHTFKLYDYRSTKLYQTDLIDPLQFWHGLAEVLLLLGHRLSDFPEAFKLGLLLEHLCEPNYGGSEQDASEQNKGIRYEDFKFT